MNQVALIGRLTKDVELRYAQSGTAVANFTIAVDRKFQKQGEERQADFIPVVTFGKTAEFCNNYFTKGLRVGVTGSIQTRTWTDNENKKHYATEVLADGVDFADGKSSSGGNKPTTSEDEEFEL